MNFHWTALALVLVATSALAEPAKTIYRWKDDNGNWVYSDIPKQGAEEIQLTHRSLSMPSENVDVLNTQTHPKTPSFEVFVTAPSHEQTIRENTGSVYVTGRVAPRFLPSMQAQLFLNGEAVSEKQGSISFALREVPRGEHQLQIKVFGAEGKLVAESALSTFFMHRASVLNKP